MTNIFNIKNLLLVALLVITFISFYFEYQSILLISFSILFILILIFNVSIKQSLLGLIMIRPSLDILGDYSLGIINLAGLMAIFSIGISIIIIYKNKKHL